MNLIKCSLIIIIAAIFQSCNKVSEFRAMTSADWTNVNGSTETWEISESSISGKGYPTSFLCSNQHYENFILEFQVLNEEENSNAAFLIHSDALPSRGEPFPRGIRIPLNHQQVRVKAMNKAELTAKETDQHKAEPGEYSFLQYQITSRDGTVTLKINNNLIYTVADAKPRKGYISLTSEGSKVEIKDIRIKKLLSSNPEPEFIATVDEGFTSLFDGLDLSAWELKEGHLDHWTAKDWVIDYDGQSEEKDKNLWSKKEYKDFILIADMRFTGEPEMALSPVVLPNGENALHEDGSQKQVEIPYAGDTGIYLRGNSKNQINIGNRYLGSGEIYGYRVDKKLPADVRAAVTPKIKADNPLGEWNRFIITMKGDRLSVVLNDQLVIDNAILPGIAKSGRIALQDDHANNNLFQFANIFIKEL